MVPFGGVAEWSKAVVLKTTVGQPTRGSNPFSSANYYRVLRPATCRRIAPERVLVRAWGWRRRAPQSCSLTRMPRFPRLQDLSISPHDRAALERMAVSWNDHPRPVLFAGAGLTAYNTRSRIGHNARALGWADLAKIWRRQFAAEGVTQLPTDPLRLAQLYEQAFGRSELLDTLELAVPEIDLELGPAFRALASIPWGAIITTNYDSLLERAFENTQLSLHSIVRDPDMSRRRARADTLLVKMHGDFRHRDLVVITEDDYSEYRQSRPAIATKVDQLLVEHPVLFVGFSLDDPNVARILNWVRSTVGKLQLPSVSIVHSTPSRPELELWAARGIRLAHCTRDVPLSELLTAFNRDREPLPSRVAPKVASKDAKSLAKRVNDALKDTRSNVNAAAAALNALIAYVESNPGSVSVLHGIEICDLRPVLGCLTQQELTRWMLLLVDETPFFTYNQTPRRHYTVNVVVGLLAFGALSVEAMIDLALRWIRQAKRGLGFNELKHGLRLLRELRGSHVSDSYKSELTLEIRDVAFLMYSEAELRAELNYVGTQDPIELCRRGADYLLLGDSSEARSWYTLARDRSQSGDEMYAALLGLHECDDWNQEIQLEIERIPGVLRPRTESVLKIRDGAARLAMDGSSWGYEDFIREARALGWPHSSRRRAEGQIEVAAREIAKTSLRETSSRDPRRAIAWLLRTGGFAHDSIGQDDVEAIVRTSGGRAWLEDWLHRRPSAPRQRQSQRLFSIACFDVMSDSEMGGIVADVLADATKSKADFGGYGEWRLLSRNSQRLPVESSLLVVDRLAALIASGKEAPVDSCGTLSPWLWPMSGRTISGRPEIRLLVDAVLNRLAERIAIENGHERQQLLRLVDRLNDVGALTVSERRKFCKTLRPWLYATLAKLSENDVSRLLDLASALCALGEDRIELASKCGDALVKSYEYVSNSTLLGRWCYVVREIGAMLPAANADKLIGCLAEAALSAQNRRDDAFFPVFALDISLAISRLSSRASVAERQRALGALVGLGRERVDALPALLSFEGISVKRLREAEAAVVSAMHVANDEVRREESIRALVAWCELAENRASARVWELLVGVIELRPLPDDSARPMLGWFAKHGLIPDVHRDKIAALVLAGVDERQRWPVRVRSAGALRLVSAGTVYEAKAIACLRKLAEDRVALVRRVAERSLFEGGFRGK